MIESGSDDERSCRDAIAAGETFACNNLAILLARQPGRQDEAEAAYREAIAAGHVGAHSNLGILLTGQPDRQEDAEAALREVIAAGENGAWNILGILFARQRGRQEDAEAAYREAIAAGDTEAWNNLGLLLDGQPGRESEAEAAYREAIACGAVDRQLEDLTFAIGDLRARRGDVAGARASYEVAIPLRATRMDGAVPVRSVARLRVAIARRPWARRVSIALRGVGRRNP